MQISYFELHNLQIAILLERILERGLDVMFAPVIQGLLLQPSSLLG